MTTFPKKTPHFVIPAQAGILVTLMLRVIHFTRQASHSPCLDSRLRGNDG